MGDIGGAKKNGAVQNDQSAIKTPDPSKFSKEFWVEAEKAIEEVIKSVHPNLGSEEKRMGVIDYMQRLFKHCLGFEVSPFGSVPLKTYLPDGDIDLTVLGSLNVANSWFTGVLSVLQHEEHNEIAEYEVKDTQFIDAEVKVVKCIVRNIVIDISFNQLGGISTLCFLEKVDQIVGKDHLFKRSIILIKSWCYYESRILASNHGLLSTYAVETLVLCIFQMFHSSLDTSISVLYLFLDYFSKFDWENYGISVNGPFRKSSLPDIVFEMPENGGKGLLLDAEFFSDCIDIFTASSKDSGSNPRMFQLKNVNIMDPMKDHNNLGRSVHRGNFYRIRSAFNYGARKLGAILSLPKEEFAEEIKNFFSSTVQRHLYKTMWDSRYLLEGSRALDDVHVGSGICYNNCTSDNSWSNNGSVFETDISEDLDNKKLPEEFDPCYEQEECVESLAVKYKLKEKDTEPLNPLSNPTGDMDSHIRGLSYWKCWFDPALAVAQPPPPPQMVPMVGPPVLQLSQFAFKNAWEPFYPQQHQPLPYNMPNSYSYPSPIPPAFMEPPPSFYGHEGKWNNNQGPRFRPPLLNQLNQGRPSFQGKALGSRVQPWNENFYGNNGGYVPGFVERSSSSWRSTGPCLASRPQPALSRVYRRKGIVGDDRSNSRAEEDGDATTGGCGGDGGGSSLTKTSSQMDIGSPADDEVVISGSAGSVVSNAVAADDKGKTVWVVVAAAANDKGKAAEAKVAVTVAASSTTKEHKEKDGGGGVFYFKEEEFPVLSMKKR